MPSTCMTQHMCICHSHEKTIISTFSCLVARIPKVDKHKLKFVKLVMKIHQTNPEVQCCRQTQMYNRMKTTLLTFQSHLVTCTT